MTSDWKCPFSVDTPWHRLQEIVTEQTNEALLAMLEALLNETALTDTQRAKAFLKVAPEMRRRTRTVLEAAWTRLRLEATAGAEAVH